MLQVSPAARRAAYVALGSLTALAPLAAHADAPPALDTTGYSAIFGTLSSDLGTVATGPVGIAAFGVLTVGIVFRIVWKLYKKSSSSIG